MKIAARSMVKSIFGGNSHHLWKTKIDVAVGKTWNVTNIENDNKEELQYELFKEKLKVEKQDMLFFSWMKSLSVQLNAPLHQKMTEHGLADDNTRLEWFNIPLLRRSQSRKKVPYPSLRQMSSVLEVQCNTLTEEKLNFCVGFSDKPLSEWKPQILSKPTIDTVYNGSHLRNLSNIRVGAVSTISRPVRKAGL